MRPEMKPCPFCGVALVLDDDVPRGSPKLFLHPQIGAPCVAEGLAIWDNDAERIAAWNRRSPPIRLGLAKIEDDRALEAINPTSVEGG